MDLLGYNVQRFFLYYCMWSYKTIPSPKFATW
jgi:hypothetical protein